MKAILEYGRFTQMIELPSFQSYIHILKPYEEVSYVPLEEIVDVTKVEKTKLEFRIKRQLTEDLYLYEFVSES